ncbi:hypothetical protein ACFX19_005775 [Malus domestica]
MGVSGAGATVEFEYDFLTLEAKDLENWESGEMMIQQALLEREIALTSGTFQALQLNMPAFWSSCANLPACEHTLLLHLSRIIFQISARSVPTGLLEGVDTRTMNGAVKQLRDGHSLELPCIAASVSKPEPYADRLV